MDGVHNEIATMYSCRSLTERLGVDSELKVGCVYVTI